MFYQLAADVIILLHSAFIVFVLLGGLLVVRRRWVAWLHIPAVIWGALIVIVGWTCPLTPLENELRRAGGGEAYVGGFIDRYIEPVIYPPGFTPEMGLVMGITVVVINVGVYGMIGWRSKRQKRSKENGNKKAAQS